MLTETTDDNGWADENMNQNENGKECKSYMNYMFLIFIIAAITPIVESGASHLLKTHSYTKMSNKEFLEDMFREFNKLVNEKYVNKGLLDSESAEKILSDLKDKLLNTDDTDDTDSSKAGELIKSMFKESLELMRVNAAAYGDYSTTVTNFLIEKVPTKHLLEALRGGNFVVEDGGAIYNYTSTNMLSIWIIQI